jgi:hypothetical protein
VKKHEAACVSILHFSKLLPAFSNNLRPSVLNYNACLKFSLFSALIYLLLPFKYFDLKTKASA